MHAPLPQRYRSERRTCSTENNASHGCPQGKVLVVGDYDDARADFVWNDLLHSELEPIGSNAGTGAWAEAVELAVGGEIPLSSIITVIFQPHTSSRRSGWPNPQATTRRKSC